MNAHTVDTVLVRFDMKAVQPIRALHGYSVFVLACVRVCACKKNPLHRIQHPLTTSELLFLLLARPPCPHCRIDRMISNTHRNILHKAQNRRKCGVCSVEDMFCFCKTYNQSSTPHAKQLRVHRSSQVNSPIPMARPCARRIVSIGVYV